MFAALSSGEIDLIPNLGITERRKEFAISSDPVGTFGIGIFTRKDSEPLQSLSELNGKRVAVIERNVGEVLIKDYPGIISHTFAHVEDGLFNLLSGDVDALIFPRPVIYNLAEKAGLLNHMQSVAPSLIEIKRAISVRKDNSVLLKKINPLVKQLLVSDEYRKIYRKWYASPPEFWTVKRITLFMGLIMLIVVIALIIWRYTSLGKEVEKRTRELKDALENVKTLKGLIPICSYCKKIRDDKGYWKQLEIYIRDNSDAEFSHGICEECAKKLIDKIEALNDSKK